MSISRVLSDDRCSIPQNIPFLPLAEDIQWRLTDLLTEHPSHCP